VRELPSQPAPVVSAVFSEMSQRELADWVRDHYGYEDLTQDGEQDAKVGIARYMAYLKGLSPKDQQSFYEKQNRLYGR
jgi:negative regulator of replication initiation